MTAQTILTVNTLTRPACLILALLLLTTPARAEWFKQQEDIMGTRVSIELWHQSAEKAQACSEDIVDELSRIDALMSPYKADSEISLINQNAGLAPIRLSDEMAFLIKRSRYFSDLSKGAFDITFASIGYRYDYRHQQQPDEAFIQANLAAIDYRLIRLENGNIYFRNSAVRIDLGGIAKGYAVDRALKIIQDCDIHEAMVSAGGDSRILGEKRGKPWVIGIQHPRKKNDLALRLPLSDTAISTSGDYERFFVHNGDRIHHIIDPNTGRSAGESWSATVTGPDAMTTDALSTTVFVLGAEKGLALIESLDGIDAIIIDKQGRVHYSSGFREPDGS